MFIIQSNYIPWKGYFDAINMADIMVVYDEMQYTKNDWRNRNLIKTSQGINWLTIPIKQSGNFGQKINETKIANHIWKKKHWKSLTQYYSKASCFDEIEDIIKPLYFADNTSEYLTEINLSFIKRINAFLNIATEIVLSKDLILEGDRNERILNICKQLKADHYISGPAARGYLEKSIFDNAGIRISFLNYDNYPKYPQLHGAFEHKVSILDLLFNTGKNAKFYMKSFKK